MAKIGRPKGARNKATADVKRLAGKYGPRIIKQLANLAENAISEQARVAACKELLDRAYGRSVQALEHSGPGGGPIPCSWLTPDEAKALGWA